MLISPVQWLAALVVPRLLVYSMLVAKSAQLARRVPRSPALAWRDMGWIQMGAGPLGVAAGLGAVLGAASAGGVRFEVNFAWEVRGIFTQRGSSTLISGLQILVLPTLFLLSPMMSISTPPPSSPRTLAPILSAVAATVSVAGIASSSGFWSFILGLSTMVTHAFTLALVWKWWGGSEDDASVFGLIWHVAPVA